MKKSIVIISGFLLIFAIFLTTVDGWSSDIHDISMLKLLAVSTAGGKPVAALIRNEVNNTNYEYVVGDKIANLKLDKIYNDHIILTDQASEKSYQLARYRLSEDVKSEFSSKIREHRHYMNLSERLFDQAKILYEAQQFEMAEQLIDEALSYNPDIAGAYYIKGYIRHLERQLEDAFYFYKKALSLEENFPQAYYCIALIYYQKSMYQDAAYAIDQALFLNPGYEEAELLRKKLQLIIAN